jgi:hypothetical protein
VESGKARYESFELLLKFGKSSFLRKQESSPFKTFWIPAYAGMTKWGYFSKLSLRRHRDGQSAPPKDVKKPAKYPCQNIP